MLFDGGEEGLRGAAEDGLVVVALARLAAGFFFLACARVGAEAGAFLGDFKVRFARFGEGLEVVFYRHFLLKWCGFLWVD